MDKMKVLRCLSNSNCFPFLSDDELKLYILLLVDAVAFNQEGCLDLRCIRRALGRDMTEEGLKRLGNSLERFNLASVWVDARGVFRYKLKDIYSSCEG